MQKKLIALAILGLASSAAFADVGIYGVLDGGVANLSGTGQQSQFLAQSGGLAQSRLGVKATEKLDDGLTAVAVLEYGYETQTAAGLSGATARQQLLGLAGDFGTVATGYLQTTGFDFGAKYDPFADGGASVLQSLTGAGGASTGNNNFLIGTNALAAHGPRALAYISPSMGGVTVALNYSTAVGPIGATTTTAGLSGANGLGNAGAASGVASDNNTAFLASAAYDNGPLSATLVYASASLVDVGGMVGGAVTTSTATSTEYAIGASYNFGVAKVNATYQSNAQSVNSGATTTNTAYSVSATAPVGPGTVAAEYAASSINSSSSNGATGYSLAYLQGLSKTTTAYVAYSGITNGSNAQAFGVLNNATAGSTLSLGGSTTLIAAGISKKF
jgi:predicted porin